MRFVFLDAPAGVAEKVIFQQEYSRAIPLRSATPGMLIEGWNYALAQVLAEVISDFGHSATESSRLSSERAM